MPGENAFYGNFKIKMFYFMNTFFFYHCYSEILILALFSRVKSTERLVTKDLVGTCWVYLEGGRAWLWRLIHNSNPLILIGKAHV